MAGYSKLQKINAVVYLKDLLQLHAAFLRYKLSYSFPDPELKKETQQ